MKTLKIIGGLALVGLAVFELFFYRAVWQIAQCCGGNFTGMFGG